MTQYKTLGPHVASFCAEFCVHTIGEKSGEPLVLDQYQCDFVDEMFLVGWNHASQRWDFVYQSILFGVPRGAGKSTMSAALALYALSPFGGTNAPIVQLAAATRENAMNVFGPAADMVRMSPRLADIFVANKATIYCEANRGLLKRLSADGKSNFGAIPSFINRDELHTWVTDRQVQLSEALQTALVKRENSQSLATTTAGYDKNTLLGEAYDAALRSPHVERPASNLTVVRDHDAASLFWWYDAPHDMAFDDPKAWRLANPGEHISIRKLELAFNDPSTSQDEFKRQHLNWWSRTKKAWFDVGVWRGLRRDGALGEIPEGKPVQLAIDASLTTDSTALSWAWASGKDDPVVVDCHVWSAVEDVPHDTFCGGGTIDLDLVVEYITDVLNPKFQITEIVYDPRFMDAISRKLSDLGFTVAPMHQASPQMADAYQTFYSAVRSGGIVHNGNDVLAQHVENCGAQKTERGWRVFKLKQSRRIDACVSTVMAYSRARAALEQLNRKYIVRRSEIIPPKKKEAP